MPNLLLSPDFPWHVALSIWTFALGACIGSFLNVCIYRIPRELSVVRPRSACPHCGKPIPWHCNIPLFSYLALRARCLYCKGRISPRYFWVEGLVGLLFLLVWLCYPPSGSTPPLGLVPIADWKLIPVYWLVVSGLVLGTFVDFEHLIIPDRVTLGGIVAGLILTVAVPSLHGQTRILPALLQSGIGILAGAGSLYVMGVLGSIAFRKEAMGLGDVKLLGALGAFLGWKAVCFIILISSLAGSIVGMSLVALRLKHMQSRIPYGPYLALAAVIWILWGPTLWSGYLNLAASLSSPGL